MTLGDGVTAAVATATVAVADAACVSATISSAFVMLPLDPLRSADGKTKQFRKRERERVRDGNK